MSVKSVRPANQPQGLSFFLMPKKIKAKDGRANIKLAAILSCPYFVPDAEILASIKNNKQKIVITSKLKEVLKKMEWKVKDLEPLVSYIKSQLKEGSKHPELFVGILNTYLVNGAVPNFTVNYSVQNQVLLGTIPKPIIVEEPNVAASSQSDT